MSKIEVSISFRDKWIWEKNSQTHRQTLFVQGCKPCLELISRMKNQFGLVVESWPVPERPQSHSEVLLKELILKASGQWKPPFEAEEICHCRAIPRDKVIEAIKAGAHSTDLVSRWTSASTACGTCRPDVENLIKYLVSK